MKKRLDVLIISLFLTLLFITFPVTVSAENKLLIKNYNGSANILSNGDMDYEETLTYKFTGNWNGVTRGVSIDLNKQQLENIKVSEISGTSQSSYILNNEARNGDVGYFSLVLKNDIPTIYIFSASKNTTKTFKLSYTVTNAVVKHQDIAELYHKFIGEENSIAIENASIDINTPLGAKKGDIKIFAHGGLNGNSKIINDNSVNLSITNVNAGNFIEGRLLFPLNLVPESKNIDESISESDILSQEKGWADEANAQRNSARKLSSAGKYSAIILSFLLIALALYIQNKYGKEYKPDFQGEYYRELPDDCTPAVMSVLYNFGKVNSRDLSATILDLVRKRYLRLDAVDKERKGLFKKKPDQDYLLYSENKDTESLKDHEKYLLDWLINGLGNGEYVSFQKIKNISKDRTSSMEFHDKYEIFVNKVLAESDRYDYFDKSSDKGKTTLIISSVTGLLIGGLMIFILKSPWAFVLIFISLIMLVMSFFMRRRSINGSNMFVRWKAFRKFIVDFSNLKEQNVPSIVLWEHYLVYAISLGVAKNVIQELKLIMREEDFNNPGLTYLYMFPGMHYSVFDRLDQINNITYGFEEVSDNIFKTAMTNNSSSSGGGGGFSSGGGGGGGGGGFGGF